MFDLYSTPCIYFSLGSESRNLGKSKKRLSALNTKLGNGLVIGLFIDSLNKFLLSTYLIHPGDKIINENIYEFLSHHVYGLVEKIDISKTATITHVSN